MRANAMIRSIFSSCLLLVLLVGNAVSQIPQTISYQGVVTDVNSVRLSV